jgi:UDP-N-acetyl-D-glucosamine dehydrogenase
MLETPLVIDATAQALAEKIRTRRARVGIVGLGYVGLPLAVEFAKAGFTVTGIDVSTEKVRRANAGDSYIGDIPSAVLAPLVAAGKLRATTDFAAVQELDTINICVPTPLRKTKDPDMSYIVSACQEIARCFHAGMLVILESTTYPGTTDELVLPMLAKSGLAVGSDFFLCFSPERVDPGNPHFQTANIPKVVGGCTAACTEMGRLFYAQALKHVVPVSGTQVAEMVKLLENTMPPPPSPLGSCPSTPAPAWAATASPSTPSISRGRPGRPESRRGSSNWQAISTARCLSS